MILSQSLVAPVVPRKIIELKRLNRLSAIMGVTMLIAIGVISTWSLRQMDFRGYWVSHTYEVLGTANQLLLDVKDAEAAARGFLLQPAEQYRLDFQAAEKQAPIDVATLKSLTSDNPQQQERLRELLPLLSRRMETLAHLISVRTNSALPDAERIRELGQTKQDADAIEMLCRQIQNQEFQLLGDRQRSLRTRLVEAFIGILGSLFLALVALVTLSRQVRGTIRDLSESERWRREYETMAASLFEAAPESILVVDRKGLISRINPETERLFGYTVNELSGKSIEILVPNALHNDCEAWRNNFFSDGTREAAGLKFETTLRKKGDAEFIAEVSVSHMRTNNSDFAVAFTADVTKRHADERAIREYSQELQRLTARLMSIQEDERRRIARDLHDDLNQKLAFLSMDLGRLVNRRESDGIRVEIQSLQQRAKEASDFVRNISHQLHPSVLEDLGLEAALEEFCHEFQERFRVITDIECRGLPEKIRPEIVNCVYYVVAECLRNVAKHARARCVSVTLAANAEDLHAEVADDGLGIRQTPGATSLGIGIVAMRERVHFVKGTLEIHSGEKGGTRVSIQLPLNELT